MCYFISAPWNTAMEATWEKRHLWGLKPSDYTTYPLSFLMGNRWDQQILLHVGNAHRNVCAQILPSRRAHTHHKGRRESLFKVPYVPLCSEITFACSGYLYKRTGRKRSPWV